MTGTRTFKAEHYRLAAPRPLSVSRWLCYTNQQMADGNDSILDKAESFARRVLERLGSKVDSKFGQGEQQTLTPREVGDLTSRIERIIEANLREDKRGVKRVAPNRYSVLFTYEDTSRLNTQYIEALAIELKTTIFEYINNRRYETHGPIEVTTGRDLFGKTTVIKVAFEDDVEALKPGSAGVAPVATAQPSSKAAAHIVSIRDESGRTYKFELKPGGAPAYIGRAAGNTLRVDDPSLSRIHCSVALRAGGEVVISDLGSSNGTFINGRQLGANEAHGLKPGDEITVGDVKLEVSDFN